jgi:hypothetical protein
VTLGSKWQEIFAAIGLLLVMPGRLALARLAFNPVPILLPARVSSDEALEWFRCGVLTGYE